MHSPRIIGLVLLCIVMGQSSAVESEPATREPFKIDLFPNQPPARTPPDRAAYDFLLSHAPRVAVECQASDGITYPAIMSGANRCIATIQPVFLALNDTFAYYVVRAGYRRTRGTLMQTSTPGHAEIKGAAPFSENNASAAFDIESPNRAASGHIGMELLGAVAANVATGLSVVAARMGMPMPVVPPDWKAIQSAAVRVTADLQERAAEKTVLTDMTLYAWLCNPRLCSPPAAIGIAVDQP